MSANQRKKLHHMVNTVILVFKKHFFLFIYFIALTVHRTGQDRRDRFWNIGTIGVI